MHIHQGMYGYWNAAWGAPVTQAGGSSAPWVGAGSGAGSTGSPQGAQGCGDGGDTPEAGGGNLLMQALAQALESLGLSLTSDNSATASPSTPATTSTSTSTPTSSATATATSSASTSSGATASSTAAPAATSPAGYSSQVRSIAGDIRHLMHALFEDVRAENLLAPSASASGTGGSGAAASGTTSSGATAGASTPQGSFASGLAALISQIQSGSAPANLQQAFDRLVTNLEQISGAVPDPISQGAASAAAPVTDPTPSAAGSSAAAAGSSSSTGTSTAVASTAAPSSTLNYQALLVQFLTNLQTNLGLGYGGSSGTPAQSATTGLTVNTLA